MSRRPLILLAFHWYLESLHEGAMRHFLENGCDTAVLNSDSAAAFAGKPVAGILGMQPAEPHHPVRRFCDAFAGPVVELSLAFPEKTAWGRSPEDCEAIGRLASQRLRRLPNRLPALRLQQFYQAHEQVSHIQQQTRGKCIAQRLWPSSVSSSSQAPQKTGDYPHTYESKK